MDTEIPWRTVGAMGLVFLAGVAVAAVGLPDGGSPDTASIGPSSETPADAGPATDTPSDAEPAQGTATAQATPSDGPVPNTDRYEMNTTYVELAVHERINDIRQERSLPLLDYNATLAEVAGYHSEDMATYLYLAHESPDNETMADRYDRFGFDCSIPKHDGTGSYATGDEVLDKTFYREQIVREDGSLEYYDTLDKLAAGIVRDWMNQRDQRNVIEQKYWQRHGIGVTAYEDSEGRIVVLATQNFC